MNKKKNLTRFILLLLVLASCEKSTTSIEDKNPNPKEVTCRGPRISPPLDSLKIAFTSRQSGKQFIYLMDLNGQNLKNVTTNLDKSYDPLFTPDASGIVFTSFIEPYYVEFFIYDFLSDSIKQISTTKQVNAYFDISSDGCKIVYTELSTTSIWIMDIDGGNRTRLTGSAANAYPRFSPDGTKIVFTSGRGDAGMNDNVYIMNYDGSDQIQLTSSDRDDILPSFTPDGNKIIYTSRNPDRSGHRDIILMDLDGSNKKDLTGGMYDNLNPCVSSDGTKICFERFIDSIRELFIMDITGENQIRLTTSSGDNYGADISYEGSKIVFTSERDGNPEIYIMDINGSNQQRLTFNPGDDSWPVIL